MCSVLDLSIHTRRERFKDYLVKIGLFAGV